jgi:hypothetical protein
MQAWEALKNSPTQGLLTNSNIVLHQNAKEYLDMSLNIFLKIELIIEIELR